MGLVSVGVTAESTTRIDTHVHPRDWEVVYYTSGEGVNQVGSHRVAFRPGTIICQPPGVPHREESLRGFTNIFAIVEDFEEAAAEVPVYEDTNGDFHRILYQLHSEYHMKRPNWERLCECLLDVLRQYLIAWNNSGWREPQVERLKQLLAAHMTHSGFRISDALAAIPLADDYLRRRFKHATGQTPMEYLIELRLSHAKQLLQMSRENGMSVKHVGHLSGFADPYYFSRIFKRRMGVSPTAWVRCQAQHT